MADGGRVIAGSARGIRLAAAGAVTRPLGDRVKQTLFAILEPDLADRRVLDLFAGIGAAGIEALSRGAPGAVFVDADPHAIVAIRENLSRCHLDGAGARVVRADVARWLATDASAEASAGGAFGLVVIDPPYERHDLLTDTLDWIGGASADGIVSADAIVIAKSFWRDAPPDVVGLLASERTRRFGETALTFYRRQSKASTEA